MIKRLEKVYVWEIFERYFIKLKKLRRGSVYFFKIITLTFIKKTYSIWLTYIKYMTSRQLIFLKKNNLNKSRFFKPNYYFIRTTPFTNSTFSPNMSSLSLTISENGKMISKKEKNNLTECSLLQPSLNHHKNSFYRISLEIQTSDIVSIGIFQKEKMIEKKFISYIGDENFWAFKWSNNSKMGSHKVEG